MEYADAAFLISGKKESPETDLLLESGYKIRIRALPGTIKFKQEDLSRYEYIITTLQHGIIRPVLNEAEIKLLIDADPGFALELFDRIQAFTADSFSGKKPSQNEAIDFIDAIREIEKQRKDVL